MEINKDWYVTPHGKKYKLERMRKSKITGKAVRESYLDWTEDPLCFKSERACQIWCDKENRKNKLKKHNHE